MKLSKIGKNFVAYHWEGCETFELGGATPLSMESLDNNRFLFLTNNPNNWKSERLYEVQLRKVKTYVAPSQEAYNLFGVSESKLFGVSESKYATEYHWTPRLCMLVENGFRFFVYEPTNGEMPEGFLVYPKESVVSIARVK